MFNRMNLPTRLTGFTALVIVSAAALSITASAAKWSQATSVEAVCKRTNCWSDTATNGSSTVGCGVSDGKGHTCFICDNKKGKRYFFKKSVVEGNAADLDPGPALGMLHPRTNMEQGDNQSRRNGDRYIRSDHQQSRHHQYEDGRQALGAVGWSYLRRQHAPRSFDALSDQR